MPNPEEYSYATDNLIVGDVHTAKKSVLAGTYYRGQAMARPDASTIYAELDTGGATTGEQKLRAVCAADVTLAAAGNIPCYITGSELNGEELKDNNGATLPITDELIENAQDFGIILRKRN